MYSSYGLAEKSAKGLFWSSALVAFLLAFVAFGGLASAQEQADPPVSGEPVEGENPADDSNDVAEEPQPVFTPPSFPSFSRSIAGRAVVSVSFDERDGLVRSGIVIGDDTIVAPLHGVRRNNGNEQVTITHNDGVTFGRVASRFPDFDIVTITAPGLPDVPSTRFASSSPVAGQPLSFLARTANSLSVVLGSTGTVNGSRISAQLNNAISGQQQGGAIFNNCGQLAGFVTSGEGNRAARSLNGFGPSVEFVNASQLKSLVASTLPSATARCLTPAEQTKAIDDARDAFDAEQEQRAKAKAEEDAKREAEEVAKREADEEAKRKAEEAELRKAAEESSAAAAAERRRRQAAEKAAEEAAKANEEELSAVEKRAEEEEAARLEAQERAEEEEKKRLEAETAANARQKWLAWGGIGGSLLLLIGGAVAAYLLGKQRKVSAAAQSDASQQRQYAEELKSNIPPAPVADCLLYGPIGLKLPGASLPEAAGGVVVGRDPSRAQVVYDQPDISRGHARFFVRNGDTILEDLNSSNGTFINNRQLSPGQQYTVMPGDQIRFGKHGFEFKKLG